MALPKPTQSVAATMEDVEPATFNISATIPTPAPAPDFSSILQQLASNQKALAEQIAALHQNF